MCFTTAVILFSEVTSVLQCCQCVTTCCIRYIKVFKGSLITVRNLSQTNLNMIKYQTTTHAISVTDVYNPQLYNKKTKNNFTVSTLINQKLY